MHFEDGLIIFVIALILFGPKKLPEIARQIGKLMAEFRRASNEFKTQIDEELRSAEQVERQKQLSAAAVASAVSEPMILPPATGVPVSQYAYGDPADAAPPALEPGSEAARLTDGESESAGQIVPPASSFDQEMAEAIADETPAPPYAAPHASSASAYGSLLSESTPSFGAPNAPEATAGVATATVPLEPSLNGNFVEGSAAENAQAGIHHG